MTVWKVEIELADHQVVQIPRCSEILHVAEQRDHFALWFRCNPSEPLVPYDVVIRGTGHPLPDNPPPYVGTLVTVGGALVWHVFAGLAVMP